MPSHTVVTYLPANETCCSRYAVTKERILKTNRKPSYEDLHVMRVSANLGDFEANRQNVGSQVAYIYALEVSYTRGYNGRLIKVLQELSRRDLGI